MIRVLIFTQNGDVTEVYANKENVEVDIVDKEEDLDDTEVEEIENKYPHRIL